jgi:hypothetical protein
MHSQIGEEEVDRTFVSLPFEAETSDSSFPGSAKRERTWRTGCENSTTAVTTPFRPGEENNWK